MSSFIRDRAASSAEMIAVFGDESLVRAALDIEAALARAEAEAGLIPTGAADLIVAACRVSPISITQLAEAAAHAGTLAIPLVAHLRAAVELSDAAAARFVHLGFTSQDLADTAMMMQAKAGAALIVRDADRLARALAHLARLHAMTPMIGRTLLQGALPITFGLKAAQWLMGVDASLDRLKREADSAIAIQFGGAVGSLAGVQGKGSVLGERLAQILGLAAPPLPWQARRDGVAGLASALAILAGAIGKIAGDVALLAQGEVAEAFEPRVPGRGGSSVMAHKRNPTGCQVALSAAIRAPGLAVTIVAALPQEHERGLGGWQAESAVLADLFAITHGALSAMVPVIEGLEIDSVAMATNLERAAVGRDVGDSAALVERALRHHETRTSR